MMMAPDSSLTSSNPLGEETVNAVRLALRAYLRDGSEPNAVQPALLLMASEAHARSILPEQLLVILKDVWNTLPEVRAMSDSREQIRLLQRVVTMCIKEYYRA